MNDTGFAHEDWNFAPDVCADGHVYGYTYFHPHRSKAAASFNVMFGTYERGCGWALCGYYKAARFEKNGATFSRRILRRRARELKALADDKWLGGRYRRASVDEIIKLLEEEARDYRWQVLPGNIHRLKVPIQLPRSRTSRFGTYFARPTYISEAEWNGFIKIAASFADREPEDDYSDGGEIEFPEGRAYEAKHKKRERSQELVVKAKRAFRAKHGRLFCEVCNFDFERTYGGPGEGFIEAHHIIPVSELKPGSKTKVSDLALVCSNCHRMLHRRRPWLAIPELRKLIGKMAS